MAPWADVLYACDGEWWDKYFAEVRDIFSGELWTQDSNTAGKYGLSRVPGNRRSGLGKDGIINFGGNGGYQLINLVYYFGARKIVLLGFDMQRTGGKSHFHGDHPGELNRSLPFGDWIARFWPLARDLEQEGVEVINASRETALECFPRKDIEECLWA